MSEMVDALKNHVNDMINTHRKLVAMVDDPALAEHHPALKELVHRLDTQMAASKDRMAKLGVKEPDLGQPEPGTPTDPQAHSRTLDGVLSSPYAGEEPRYAAHHGGAADPVERVAPSPRSESAGRTDEADPMPVHRAGPPREAPPSRLSASPPAKK